MEGRVTKTGEPVGRGCCVLLWSPVGLATQPPSQLTDSLARRGLNVTIHTCAHAAMAEVVLLERQGRSAPVRQPVVLLVVQPETVRGSAELVKAVAAFCPHATTWQYDAAANPPLRAMANAPARPPQPTVVVRPVNGTVRPRPVAAVGAPAPSAVRDALPFKPTADVRHDSPPPPPAADMPPRDTPDDEANPAALSSEELDMLLSDEWNFGAHEPRQRGGDIS